MAPTGPSFLMICLVILFILAIIVSIVIYFLKTVKREKTPAPSFKEEPEILKSKEVPPQPKTGIIASRQEPLEPIPEQKCQNIFVSYRRDDSNDITGRIYDWLVQHFGADHVFKDVDSIPLGVDFRQHLDQAVSQCSVLLTVIGTDWLFTREKHDTSRLHDPTDFVRIEVESALQRDIPLIPLFVQNATMPSAEKLPDSLKTLVYRNGISIRPDPDFHNDMNRLIRAIDDYVQQ